MSLKVSQDEEDAKILREKARPGLRNLGLFKVSTVVYGIMAAAGALVIAFGHKNLADVIGFERIAQDPLRNLLSAGLAAGLLLILSYFFEDWFSSFRDLKAVITRVLGPCSIPMALYLAVVSSIGEEMLFRGAIQPFAGLVLTSILFGILHLGQDGRITAWSVWAIIAGLLLGWLFEATGSLWPSILAHFLVNTISILAIRRSYRNWLASLEKQGTSES